MSPKQLLTDPGTLVVFTYAPVGLGHLRVTNSLSEGLPKGVKTVLLGSSDSTVEAIYKFMSIHVVTRRLMEWFQNGTPERVYTSVYRKFSKFGVGDIKKKVHELLFQQVDVPKRLIIVASHFGLAHKLAAVKKELEEETGVSIFLAVQVTDDSPQFVWYVPGADLIFVPSKRTMNVLKRYALRSHLKMVDFEVLPYPISPILGRKLSEVEYESRCEQLSKDTAATIEFCLPVSGAAVGMEFFLHLIPQLQSRHSKFIFNVVCRDVPFTKKFLQDVRSFPNVKIFTSKHDREIVDMYDNVYKNKVISLEITKPSEQAFKALFDFDMRGGSLILFSHPVGRQERDNLNFLRDHNLMFDRTTTEKLWRFAINNQSIDGASKSKLIPEDSSYRCIELPFGSSNTTNFIWWCLKNGIFEKMIKNYSNITANKNIETQSNGVELFWSCISSRV